MALYLWEKRVVGLIKTKIDGLQFSLPTEFGSKRWERFSCGYNFFLSIFFNSRSLTEIVCLFQIPGRTRTTALLSPRFDVLAACMPGYQGEIMNEGGVRGRIDSTRGGGQRGWEETVGWKDGAREFACARARMRAHGRARVQCTAAGKVDLRLNFVYFKAAETLLRS